LERESLATENIGTVVQLAKERLKEGYESLKSLHYNGAGGLEICKKMASQWSRIVKDLFRASVSEFHPTNDQANEFLNHVALVALGGFGRQSVAPFSDVDLMLLYIPGLSPHVQEVESTFVKSGFDSGMKLSLATRTIRQACTIALNDPTALTTFTEARLLVGSKSLFDKFQDRFRRQSRRRMDRSLAMIQKARRKEQSRFGESVYLLSPNVKCSRGGLREIHVFRWIGYIRFGEVRLEKLRELGGLSEIDYEQLTDAREFLLRLRNEMHFHAGRANDSLDSGEQWRIAESWCYPDGQELMPVQQLMKDYFRHSTEARYSSFQFLNDARRRFENAAFFQANQDPKVEPNSPFVIMPRYIAFADKALETCKGDLNQVLRLMERSNREEKWIEQGTWRAIRSTMLQRNRIRMSPETFRYFMKILSNPNRLANILRRLHEMGVLVKIVPVFRHAMWLLQFNQYHKYTVDEHTLIAVEFLAGFQDEEGFIGKVYRLVKRKDLLHLAMLLHDVGKGYTGDHSEVGAELSAQTAHRFGLNETETETICFLVRCHLLMSTLAFRRDVTDPSVIARFGEEVGSVEMLRMLYTLTCADIMAVAPGSLTDWRSSLLKELFLRTEAFLGDDPGGNEYVEKLSRTRAAIVQLAPENKKKWIQSTVNRLSARNFRESSPQKSLNELLRVAELQDGDLYVSARAMKKTGVLELCIGKHQQAVSGVFYRTVGFFDRNGLGVVSARVTLLRGKLIWFSFLLDDYHFNPVTKDRIHQIETEVQKLLLHPTDDLKSPPRVWKFDQEEKPLPKEKTRVVIDNHTDDEHTIVDVFAYDQTGLLYTISNELYRMELDIQFAKRGTHLDQVVDVFYVTDKDGDKILDDTRLQRIKNQLTRSIEKLESKE